MRKLTGMMFLLGTLAVSGCSTTPTTTSRTEELRAEFDLLAGQGVVREQAPVAVDEARKELNKLEGLVESNAPDDQIRQQLYITERKIDLVRESAQMKQADDFIAEADSHRKDAIIQQKDQQIIEAENTAAVLGVTALQAEERAERMEAQVQALQTEVEELSSQNTDRGLVLTLGDILFEKDKARLKENASASLLKVAEFLNEYPDRQLVIEGHTDSTGPSEYNEELSEARAESVKDALVSYGVDASRIDTEGFGEARPVESNETTFGRVQNRRVEIIILDENRNAAR